MKFLLFGAKGWIGGMVKEILEKDGIPVVAAVSRADHISAVEEEIKSVKPTHVVCWIGRTHGPENNTVDYLEQPGKLIENVRDNLFSIMVLARLGEKYGYHLTYGGTGCIFEYDDNHDSGFTEEDDPNFFGSSYSVVKGFTDRLMRMYPGVLNVRIRMPITDEVHPRNFITKIVNYKKIHSVENSMTVLPLLLPLMVDMSKKGVTGTINLVNPGKISHGEILEMVKELVDPNHTWEYVESVESLVVAKRSNCMLNADKLKELYPQVLPIRDAVRWCLERYSKNGETRLNRQG